MDLEVYTPRVKYIFRAVMCRRAVYLIYAVMPRRRDNAETAAACHGTQNN